MCGSVLRHTLPEMVFRNRWYLPGCPSVCPSWKDEVDDRFIFPSSASKRNLRGFLNHSSYQQAPGTRLSSLPQALFDTL